MQSTSTEAERTNTADIIGGWLAANKPIRQLVESCAAETLLCQLERDRRVVSGERPPQRRQRRGEDQGQFEHVH